MNYVNLALKNQAFMKRIIILFSLFSFFLSLQPASSFATVSSKSATQSAPRYKYRLKISFISIGAGIDNESYEKITSYIKSHPKKPNYNEYQKGREGERYIFMRLGELSVSERKTFIEEIRKMTGNKEIVKIEDSEKVRKSEKMPLK
jgi:hypothetical protein